MKNTVSIFLFSLLFLFNSCKKDDSPNPNDPNSLEEGTFIAKIDGKQFEATAKAEADILNSLNFKISGSNREGAVGDGEVFNINMLVLSIYDPVSSTTYTQDCNASDVLICAGMTLQVSSNGTPIYYASDQDNGGSFSIIFSEVLYESDGVIKGTFFGTLVDSQENTISITDGALHLRIQ